MRQPTKDDAETFDAWWMRQGEYQAFRPALEHWCKVQKVDHAAMRKLVVPEMPLGWEDVEPVI